MVEYNYNKYQKNTQNNGKVTLFLVLGFQDWTLDCNCHISKLHCNWDMQTVDQSDAKDVGEVVISFHEDNLCSNQIHKQNNAMSSGW